MMKRMLRRTAMVALGLLLGWYAAGFLPGSLSSGDHLTVSNEARAEETTPAPAPGSASGEDASKTEAEDTAKAKGTPVAETHEGHNHAPGDTHHDHPPKSKAAAADNHHGEGGHGDKGTQVAALVSPQHETIGWFRDVLVIVVALFVGAIVLGIPSAWFRGPLPPDPADSHHDDHASGHDDHGHGKDAHGHGKDAHGHSHDAHAKPSH